MKINNINYEIEFLRAISVLSVVFFHFGFFGFDGGFVGVDIFFVISGYLITSIISKKKEFNLTEFYLKRIRRLLPIILAVSLISLIVGIFILSPIHFNRLINTSLLSIFGISNFFFFSEAGYFDHEKIFKPLLHTWSLSVELQYYLVWPILILISQKIFKLSILNLSLLIFIFIISLSTLYSSRGQSFFYFTGFRFYEFAIGSILFSIKPEKKLKHNFFYFITGLTMIVFSIFYFNGSYNFPGIYALLPCLGAAFIIYSKFSITKFGKFIKFNFIKFLGSRSYTIYMVHWPFLIFYNYEKIGNVIFFDKIFLLLFILIISNYLFKYFEQPFRYNQNNKRLNFDKLLLGLFALTFICIVSLQIISKNEKNIFKESIFYKNEIINSVTEASELRYNEEERISMRQKNEKNYFKNKINTKKIMLIGNSHAFDFYIALNAIDPYKNKYDFDYIDFDYLYCFKTENLNDKIINYFNYKILKKRNSCEITLQDTNFKILEETDTIILASRWPKNTDFNLLIKFFKEFNENIIIVGNGQKFYDVPTLYFKRGNEINKYAHNFNLEIENINKKIIVESKKAKVKFFDKSSLNCNPNCIVFYNNILLYSDKDHFSYNAASYFGNKIYLLSFEKLLN